MSLVENQKQYQAELMQAANTARELNQRWDNEPHQVAFEMAQGKIENLVKFMQGQRDTFNAYYVIEQPCHKLINEHFVDGLNKLSEYLGLEPIETTDFSEEPTDVLDVGATLLHVSCTTYANGEISGVMYRGIRRGEQAFDINGVIPGLGSLALAEITADV